MKTFCQKVLSNQRITQNEVVKFIVEYLDLQKRTFKSQDIPAIMEMLQMGLFNLQYSVKEYCRLKQWTVTTLSDQGRVIKVEIN